MIICWSPHTRAMRDGTSSDVIHYMLDARVTEKVGRRKFELIRFPEPELLHGSPTLMTKVLEGLPHEHIYSMATLSFADEDLCVDDFNIGLPELRCRIAQTIDLFLDVAHAGLPPTARLQPLIGTHTHTGRLEVNILMPRAVWTGDGKLRAYNAHPPGAASRRLWDNFRDAMIHRHGWSDSLDSARVQWVKPSDAAIKADRDAHRHEHEITDKTYDLLKSLALDAKATPEVRCRDDLLAVIEPHLRLNAIKVQKRGRDSVTFTNMLTRRRCRMAGLLFSHAFRPGNPVIDLSADAYDAHRRAQIEGARHRLIDCISARAAFNIGRYGHGPYRQAEDIVDNPSPTVSHLPLYNLDLKGQHLVNAAQPPGIQPDAADREASQPAGIAHLGPGGARGDAGRGTEKDKRGARDPHPALNAGRLVLGLKRRLTGIITRWRSRHRAVILARAMARSFTLKWGQLADRMEALNERQLNTRELAGASDGADRTASGDPGAGGGAKAVGQGRTISSGRLTPHASDGAGRLGDGGRGGRARPDHDSDRSTGQAVQRDQPRPEGSRADPDDVGGAAERSTPLITRAAMICYARAEARRLGIPAPRLSFVVAAGNEWLQIESIYGSDRINRPFAAPQESEYPDDASWQPE
jgi:hypothetical protein